MGTDEKNQIFKHELDYLPFNGSVFCLEGFVLPTSKVGTNDVIFEIFLMHESNDVSSKFGDILLNMKFNFISINYGTPLLEMESQLFDGDWNTIQQHNNPIGQPGVEFKVAIHVEEYKFGIQVNDGMEYIYYNYTAPPWMVNWIIKEKYFCDKEEKTLNPPLVKGQKFSMVFLINEGKFEIYYADEEIYKYEHKLPVWAIQYIVAGCGHACIKAEAYRAEAKWPHTMDCPQGVTKCYVSGDVKKGDGTLEGTRSRQSSQGCGECPVPSIPCRSCSTRKCNHDSFFIAVNYCWENEEVAKACKGKSECYYAVIDDNIVEQGCNEGINWNETNVQIIKCSMPICNTKDLYDNTLFCLNKGKDDLETKKARDKCYDEICFVHRHWDDGKLEQGCGKCPENVHETDCITCKTKFCNEESKVKKFCWDDNSSDKKCRTSFDDYCFAERKQNNKFEYSVNKGCGNCSTLACKSCKENLCNDGKNIPNNFCLNSDGKSVIDCDDYECYINLDFQTGCGNCDKNKINEPCVDCKGLNCNTKDIIDKALFCNVKDENGNEKKGNRKCLDEKLCFISVDLNKGNLE
uniref:Galectin domain-containing protein n=1 Tax=Meloidogyne hapla TaxID=6305 RepID=A0A1I8B9E3_MELHA